MGFMHVGNGALDIYKSSYSGEAQVYGPQHLDYTPWQSGAAHRHLLDSYLARMKLAWEHAL